MLASWDRSEWWEVARHDDHAAERVRKRILEWCKEHGHGSRKALAEAVPAPYGDKKSASWATDLLREQGGADLRLRDLDAVADLLGVAPGELVKRAGDYYEEVTPSEMRFLRYFRALPDVIRGHVMAYVDYIYSFHEQMTAERTRVRDERTAAARAERDADALRALRHRRRG